MKHKAPLILASIAMVFSCGLIGGAHSNKEKVEEAAAYYTPSTHYEVSDTASELASYYSSISDSDTGTSLLSKLQSLNSTKRKKTMGYSGIGTSTSGAVIYTDYDLNSTAKDSNGQTYGTKVASFYTKTAATSWNREHVWPNSHGGDKVEGDILHTRPTISSENSSRGNSFYVEGKNHSADGWDPYTAGYDIECRGECARIILYSVVASSSLNLAAVDKITSGQSGYSNTMGNMNTLIKWHFDYAPSVYEMNRNNGAEYLQGNRNPFVDHPEYVARIWSSFNSIVSTLCTNNSSKYENWEPGNYCEYGSNTPVNTDGVTISSSSQSISVGNTTTLSATASNSGTISWTTSNSSVASISSSSSASGASITVTGVSAGTATITAKTTISGTQYSKTCTVTVTKVVNSLSKGSTSPTKTTYTAGESFDPTGLTITATYSDSTQGNVTSSVVWTPDPLTAGTTSVTGTFGGKSIVISGLTVNAATEPEIIDNNSDLSVGDYVVLRTAAGVGVTGWNNNKDATVSETESQWKKYYVASASSSGFTLKDESANNFIANPGSSNQFVYGSAATCSTDPSGHLICNSRYLCKNGTNYRFYTSVGSYLPFFIYKVPATKTLSSISVSTSPTKTTYTAGEYFDPTGLVITRTYSDSTSDTYTYANHTSDFTFSPTTSAALTTSNVSVTITYGGKSCNQAITVNAAKTLSSISVSTAPTKTSYYAGQTFDPTGLVITRTYSDSTSDTYTYANHTSEFTFSPSTSTALTTSNVSVTITYGGKSTSQAISVSAVTLTSISVSTAPTKLTYVVDEYFDPTGLVITRNYSNSTSDTYTYANHTSEFTFSPSTSTALTAQHTSVTITYGGKSCSQAITVNTSGGGDPVSGDSETIVMSEQGFTSGGSVTSASGEYCTVSFSQNGGSNGPKYYDSGSSVRLYPSNKMTITSTSNNIIQINITFGNSDGSNAISVDVGSFTSPTWEGNSNSVTFTIGGSNGNRRIQQLEIIYEESGTPVTPTSISASVSKTFYVGDTISASDITVKDNNNKTVSSFTFANDGYQFTYADAASGGALTSKTFNSAISGANLTCSLTVQVQRKAYAASSSQSITLTSSSVFNGIGGSNNNLLSGTVVKDGVTYEYYKSYYYSGGSSISFGNSSSQAGYVTNQTAFNSGITDVTVTSSGRSVNIRYSEDGSTWVLKASATPSTKTYKYFKVDCVNVSGSNYSNITVISITVNGGETATNLSNYVMYEDTSNQCTSKFDVAKGYFESMSSSERSTFMTSSDYVITTARVRLQAWATHEGKVIKSSNGDYVVSDQSNVVIASIGTQSTNILVIVVLGLVATSAIGGYFFIKHRKEN